MFLLIDITTQIIGIVRGFQGFIDQALMNQIYCNVDRFVRMEEADFQELQNNSEDFLPKDLFLGICIAIVRESLDQLSVLKCINTWPDVEATPYGYETAVERFSDDATLFRRNCVFIQTLLRNLLNELANEGAYEKFKTALETYYRTKADEEELLTWASNKGKEVETLQDKLSEEKEASIQSILNCMADIGRVKDDTENQINGNMKLKYVVASMNAQIEMIDILSRRKHQEMQEKINKLNIEINQEERIHQEISTAYNWLQKELQNKLENWQRKYDHNLEDYNKKINGLQKQQDQQLAKIRNHKELYEKRQKEMDAYKEYKIQQEELRKEMERKNRAATTIEAWWRGTMVRKGFGKFRKKKEKKLKKKSSTETKSVK